MNEASQCYSIYWNDILIGFRTYLSFPSGVIKHAWRGSRLVILPDYQNLGFGSAVLEFLGEYYLSKGLKYFDRSSHLRLKAHWSASPKWVETSSSGKVTQVPKNPLEIQFGKRDTKLGRIAYSFEFMGKDYVEKPHLRIYIEDTNKIDYSILKNDLIKLKKKYWICITTGEINTDSEIENICMELGIRTELLYITKQKQVEFKSDCLNHKIITVWNNELSEYVENNIDDFMNEIIPDKFCDDTNVIKNIDITKKEYSIKKQELW